MVNNTSSAREGKKDLTIIKQVAFKEVKASLTHYK
jgi:hypothetical protein